MPRVWLCCLLCLVLDAPAVIAAGYDDFALGVSALNRGDNDLAIAKFTSALAAGDLSPSLVPVAYFDRARLYLTKEECGLAAADLSAATKLKPDYADAYLARAAADRCLDDTTAMAADFAQAIALRPTAAMYGDRGLARWNEGDFAGAAQDLAQSVKLNPKAPYMVLWLELSRLRAGIFVADVAAADESALDLDGWPEPIIELYIGKATPDRVMRAAAEGSAATVVSQQCEANFYVAQWWIVQQKTDAAKPLLESARASCPHNFREYTAAEIELRRLK